VLPESLEAVSDTEVNVPPAIVATDPPSTERATIPGIDREFSVTTEDANLGDTLHLRFFVDYASSPTPPGPAALADVPPPAEPKPGDFRRPSVTVTIFCDDRHVPPDGANHILTAVVADRPFIDNKPPLFRAVPSDTATAEVSWTVTCAP
jgi:hypothetical protein